MERTGQSYRPKGRKRALAPPPLFTRRQLLYSSSSLSLPSVACRPLYRNVAQSSNVPSVELVIKKFLAAATAKVVAAQASAASLLSTENAAGGDEQEEVDLDAPLEPSTLLLMSVDAQRDRTDRQVVLPALRFLWECLRVCLEVLRNSARLEIIYQSIVNQAFQFCVEHARKTEFRRLCEIIRKDLATVNKYAHQPNTINLSDPDVLARHLETRFQQLNSAVELELWQEAFRSVEDIQGLLSNPASKKAQKPAMMANYYEKLTRVFKAEGGSMAVFHAAAWGRYMMYVEKGKDGDEMEKLAGYVLLSALAVPVMEDGEGKKNAGKLVTLLNLPKMPTRAGLLKEAVSSTSFRSGGEAHSDASLCLFLRSRWTATSFREFRPRFDRFTPLSRSTSTPLTFARPPPR